MHIMSRILDRTWFWVVLALGYFVLWAVFIWDLLGSRSFIDTVAEKCL